MAHAIIHARCAQRSKFILNRFSFASPCDYLFKPQTRHLTVTSLNAFKLCNHSNSIPLLAFCSSEEIPDIPRTPLPDDIVNLNALGEPTFASLGLNSYWPSGWYQALLEFLHVNLDLPWWAAIATMIHISQQMQDLMKNNDTNPLNSMRLVAIQIPIFISVFAGLRGMAQLPVKSLQTGGLSWFTDLTVCDPFYILPLYSMSSIFLMFEFGADVSSRGITPGIRLAMRIFPAVGFFMIMHMPSALLWYWSISNTISIIQALILRTKPVRTYLNFPEKSDSPPQVERKGFVEGFKESMKNSRILAELEARERTDAERWQKAGMGSIPKTFAYDITKRTTNSPIDVKGTIVSKKNKQP